MALPKYTEPHYRIWHYIYLTICGAVFFFLIAPLFVIFPLSFNAEEFLSFSEGMKSLDPDAFSLRWYKDMIYGTKNPWGLAAKNSFIIAIFATIGSVILGTVAALGTTIEIPTIDGGKAKIKIPDGTQNGKQFRLKGKGMPFMRRGDFGDLYVQVKTEVPVYLNKKQKELLEQFREIENDKSNPSIKKFFQKAKDFWKN